MSLLHKIILFRRNFFFRCLIIYPWYISNHLKIVSKNILIYLTVKLWIWVNIIILLSYFHCREVEKAIKCTNRANRKCSKTAKTDLNKIVRYIIGLRQPPKEDIEDDPKPTEPPKPWYYRIFQPFINFWRSVRSFFGF